MKCEREHSPAQAQTRTAGRPQNGPGSERHGKKSLDPVKEFTREVSIEYSGAGRTMPRRLPGRERAALRRPHRQDRTEEMTAMLAVISPAIGATDQSRRDSTLTIVRVKETPRGERA